MILNTILSAVTYTKKGGCVKKEERRRRRRRKEHVIREMRRVFHKLSSRALIGQTCIEE